MEGIPGERSNVGYVGVINSLFIPLMTFGDPAYYIPIVGNLGDNTHQLAFSRGAVGDMISSYQVSYKQAYFRAVASESVEDGWTITISDSDGIFRGYLQFQLSDNRLISTISQYSPDIIILTPLEPDGYGDGQLLAGIRYSMRLASDSDLYFPVTNEQPASGNLEGLYIRATEIDQYLSISSANFILVPVHPASYIERSPPSMGNLNQATGITQCVTMGGTGYGNSNYCLNWSQSRGFSTNNDVQPIIYYYSQDGTCGQSYIEGGVEVTTSIGESCNSGEACSYRGGQFSCTRDGILHNGWIWIAFLILIFIIILAIVVAVVLK